MVSHLFFYQLVLLGLLWLCCMLHDAWPSGHAADLQSLPQPLPPPRKLPRAPKPFPGLTPTSPIATRVSTPPRRALRPPAPRHPPASPHAAAAARWTPRAISVPLPPVAMAAGSGWAI